MKNKNDVHELDITELITKKVNYENQINELESEIKLFGNSSNRLGILNKLKFQLLNLNKDIEKLQFDE